MLILKELPKEKTPQMFQAGGLTNTYYTNSDFCDGFNSCLSLIKTKEVSEEDLSLIINLHLTQERSGYNHKPVSDKIADALIKYMEEL
jgi:hypothetical protein